MELLKEQPLQDISVSAVTKRADVNRSTFYAHYTDKYDLFHTCVRLLFEDLLEQRLPVPAEMQCEALKDLILVVCELFARLSLSFSTVNKQLDPIVDAEVQSVLYEYLLEWMQFVDDESDDAIQMRAALMSWAVVGAGIEYRYRSNGRSPEDIATVAYKLMKQPVVPEESF